MMQSRAKAELCQLRPQMPGVRNSDILILPSLLSETDNI